MKGIMRKALSLVMMLAMVATVLVVPNVDAKAATEKELVIILSEATTGDFVLDFENRSTGQAITAVGAAEDTSLGWGRTMYKFTKESDTRYSITLTGTIGEEEWINMQIVNTTSGKGWKYYPQNNRSLYNDNDALYFQIDPTDGSWPTVVPATADPEAATAQDIIDVINAIGTVELTDASKAKVEAARAAYDAFTGNKADVTNYNVLTAAEAEWTRLTTTGAAGKVTIYVKNDSWDKMYLYAWDMGNDPVSAAWPGTELTELTDNPGWYSCTFDITEAINIIFNNGSGAQTADWKYLTAGEQWVTIAADKSYTTSATAPTGWVTEAAGGVDIQIPNKGIETTAFVYASMLVIGLGLVVVACKKRFA